MLRFYPAVIDKNDDSDFGISFPDFPGCVTADPDLQTALNQAAEALSLHVDGMLEDGEAIPLPSAPDFVGDDKWVMVPLVIGSSLPMSPVTFSHNEPSQPSIFNHSLSDEDDPSKWAEIDYELSELRRRLTAYQSLSEISKMTDEDLPTWRKHLELPKFLKTALERQHHSDDDLFLMGSLKKTATAKPFSPASLKTRKTAQKPKPVTK
ncbi:type II toxin-antitoxin system HicB family antitoxin [Magnetospirillum sp. 64-120]|uniref:type II toxin-antitoxin system HicB family antitoxin n=1 Tax=Magnetospirillum sp. 64-120 TaxID=1895778 RepID=UPI0025C55B16|nr:type II toxin-antitoxin system HicB family antitoxin [Magnetospirillum sp. 64-120]